MGCFSVSHWHNAGILGMFYINIGNPRSVHPVSPLFFSLSFFFFCVDESHLRLFQSDSFRDFPLFFFLSFFCLLVSFV